jgi:hypothetical protein
VKLGTSKQQDTAQDTHIRGAPTGVKRYNLVLPEPLFREVQELAEQRHVTVLEILRKFIRLGLLVAKAEESPDTVFLLRDGDTERQLVLL